MERGGSEKNGCCCLVRVLPVCLLLCIWNKGRESVLNTVES